MLFPPDKRKGEALSYGGICEVQASYSCLLASAWIHSYWASGLWLTIFCQLVHWVTNSTAWYDPRMHLGLHLVLYHYLCLHQECASRSWNIDIVDWMFECLTSSLFGRRQLNDICHSSFDLFLNHTEQKTSGRFELQKIASSGKICSLSSITRYEGAVALPWFGAFDLMSMTIWCHKSEMIWSMSCSSWEPEEVLLSRSDPVSSAMGAKQRPFSWRLNNMGFFLWESLSAAKLRWLELSQLSLCSAFDKENSIEFLLNSVHYLYTKSNSNPIL